MCQLWDEIEACFNNLEIITLAIQHPLPVGPVSTFLYICNNYFVLLKVLQSCQHQWEEKMRLNIVYKEHETRPARRG
jgi:hypothetical protein